MIGLKGKDGSVVATIQDDGSLNWPTDVKNEIKDAEKKLKENQDDKE